MTAITETAMITKIVADNEIVCETVLAVQHPVLGIKRSTSFAHHRTGGGKAT